MKRFTKYVMILAWRTCCEIQDALRRMQLLHCSVSLLFPESHDPTDMITGPQFNFRLCVCTEKVESAGRLGE